MEKSINKSIDRQYSFWRKLAPPIEANMDNIREKVEEELISFITKEKLSEKIDWVINWKTSKKLNFKYIKEVINYLSDEEFLELYYENTKSFNPTSKNKYTLFLDRFDEISQKYEYQQQYDKTIFWVEHKKIEERVKKEYTKNNNLDYLDEYVEKNNKLSELSENIKNWKIIFKINDKDYSLDDFLWWKINLANILENIKISIFKNNWRKKNSKITEIDLTATEFDILFANNNEFSTYTKWNMRWKGSPERFNNLVAKFKNNGLLEIIYLIEKKQIMK